MNEPTELKTGQIWKDMDPREERFVRIERVSVGGALLIRKVIKQNGSWIHAPRSVERWAIASRFNGKRGGYALHSDT